MAAKPLKRGTLPGLMVILLLTGMIAKGVRLYVVTSGSMAPAIPVGSMILVSRIPFSGIREGDILTYRLNGGGTVVTHRVVSVNSRRQYLQTKGDANVQPDPAFVYPEQVIGTVHIIVPYLGLIWVRSGRILFAVSLIIMGTAGMWKAISRGKEDAKDDGEETCFFRCGDDPGRCDRADRTHRRVSDGTDRYTGQSGYCR